MNDENIFDSLLAGSVEKRATLLRETTAAPKEKRSFSFIVPTPTRVSEVRPVEVAREGLLRLDEQVFDWNIAKLGHMWRGAPLRESNSESEVQKSNVPTHEKGATRKEHRVFVPHVLCRRSGMADSVPWLDAGRTTRFLQSESEPEGRIAFRHFHSGSCFDPGTVGTDEGRAARQQRMEKNRNRSHHCISQLAELLSLRLDVQKGWRMLWPNAVLHRSFGPGFTIATNGVEVILMDGPGPTGSSCWTITSKDNIIGPVLSAFCHVRHWDYVKNKARYVFKSKNSEAEGRKSSPKSSSKGQRTPAKVRKDALYASLLRGLLEGDVE